MDRCTSRSSACPLLVQLGFFLQYQHQGNIISGVPRMPMKLGALLNLLWCVWDGSGRCTRDAETWEPVVAFHSLGQKDLVIYKWWWKVPWSWLMASPKSSQITACVSTVTVAMTSLGKFLEILRQWVGTGSVDFEEKRKPCEDMMFAFQKWYRGTKLCNPKTNFDSGKTSWILEVGNPAWTYLGWSAWGRVF